MKHQSIAIAAVMALAAAAQEPARDPAAPASEPPARVARLNWFNGNVSFQPASADTWAAATVNYPFTTGDNLYTDVGSRAEIRTGPNALRANWETSFGFLNLDDRAVQIRLTGGAVEVRLRRLEDDDSWEIDTPQGAITLLRPGDYRIETDPVRGATMLTVRSGDAAVSGSGNAFTVHPRQTAYFQEGFQSDIREANADDDFDDFVAVRNRIDDAVPPPVHVSDEMVGYEDLEGNGTWSDTVDYGWVWQPRVEAGWVPYRYGHWAWVAPWGWTWIDDASWGFAPFHYGRWAMVSGYWVWVPGGISGQPVYAPALVVFAAGPGVAWFPLGPREPYFRRYGAPGRGAGEISYANQNIPGAVTAVDRSVFVGSRPVHSAAQPVRPGQYGTIVGLTPEIPPTRESVTGPSTNRSIPVPSRGAMTRPVVVRSAPPPPAPGALRTAPVLPVSPATPVRPTFGGGQPGPAIERRVPPQGLPPVVPGREMSRPAPAPAPRVMPEARPAPEFRPPPRQEQEVRPAPGTGTHPVPRHEEKKKEDKKPV